MWWWEIGENYRICYWMVGYWQNEFFRAKFHFKLVFPVIKFINSFIYKSVLPTCLCIVGNTAQKLIWIFSSSFCSVKMRSSDFTNFRSRIIIIPIFQFAFWTVFQCRWSKSSNVPYWSKDYACCLQAKLLVIKIFYGNWVILYFWWWTRRPRGNKANQSFQGFGLL